MTAQDDASVQQTPTQPQRTPQPAPTSVQTPVSAGPARNATQSVAGGTKEAPVVASQEWVSPSTPEVVLPQEVEEAGVEAKPVMPSVPQSAQQAGVAHAKEATPVSSVKEEHVNLQTPRSVLDHLKNAHKSWKDAMSWLVRMVIKEQDRENIEDRH